MAIDAASDMLTILLTVDAIKTFNRANIRNKKVKQYLNVKNIINRLKNSMMLSIFVLILNKTGREISDSGFRVSVSMPK